MNLRRSLLLALLVCFAPLAAAAAHVNLSRIDGSINPASSSYLQKAVSASEEDGAAALAGPEDVKKDEPVLRGPRVQDEQAPGTRTGFSGQPERGRMQVNQRFLQQTLESLLTAT